MPSTYHSVIVNASVEIVCDVVKDIHNMSSSLSIILGCKGIGDILELNLVPNNVLNLNDLFHEALADLDEMANNVSYSNDNAEVSFVSPANLRNYYGTLRLRPLTTNGKTLVEWGSCWDSDNDKEVDLCYQVFVSLVQALVAKFEE